MGCAAGTGARKQTPVEETVSDPGPVVSSSWATPIKKDGQSPTGGKSGGSTPVVNMSPKGGHQQQHAGLVMQDADDDDEIEIIYETQPKHMRQQQQRQQERFQEPQFTAANSQEPPEAVEVERPKKEVPKKEEQPLSKLQQEEAAKLAERRKKFDNQRYQREQAADAGPVFNRPKDDIQATTGQKSPANTRTMGDAAAKPTSDMIMGLTETRPSDQYQQSQPMMVWDVPGGIIDDLETVQPAQNAAKKKKQTHDDVESTGFDADDERMMAEILQELDC